MADNSALHLAATGLQIGWWLFAARTLTVLIGTVMMHRVGHAGRLLQDLLGAVIFLIAIIAALAYVLDLPVKGVLATSGARGDHRRPGVAKHLERRVLRDRPQHHQALSGR